MYLFDISQHEVITEKGTWDKELLVLVEQLREVSILGLVTEEAKGKGA